MLLIVNIGNTNTTAALFEGDTIAVSTTNPTADLAYQSSIQAFCQSLLKSSGKRRDDIEGCCIASVVPAHTTVWTSFLRDAYGREPLVVSSRTAKGMTIRYDNPASLGADRICSCIAAHRLYGGPALVIDFGTATTYNLIDAEGNFLGGAIAPGIMTAARALHRSTAQLPEIPFAPPSRFPGESTRECLEAGIFFAGIDGAAAMISRCRAVLGERMKVVVTGGLGAMIQSHVDGISTVDPALVLRGAYFLFSERR